MRILFLSNGASTHTVKWVNSLSERGHEVHLVFKQDDAPKPNTINDKVILHSLKKSGTKAYFLAAYELKKLFKMIKPDIVNTHYASGYGTLARLSKIKPLVLSVWGSDVYDFPYQSKIKYKLVKKNLLYADQIASTSNCMAEQVLKLLDNYEKEIAITPFGVDIDEFKPKGSSEIGKQIIIGNIKTLEDKYGIDDLINAINLLRIKLLDKDLNDIWDKILVYIYGDGSKKEELENLIYELNLTGKVHLLGKIPHSEVPIALEKFDIFCATSKLDSESFGVAVVEAMAKALPVVVTDVDGFKEVVVDGYNGIIVKKQNIEEIANALEKLVLDEELRRKLGENGRKRVIKHYNWQENVNTMENIYEKLTNTKHRI